MANQVADALAVMATTYESDGCPIAAIQCLTALLSQQLVPDMECKLRLRMARLLLAHTTNFKEALGHLHTAQLQTQGLLGNYCLKMEVLHYLAQCYQYMDNAGKQLEAYKQGMELWRPAQSSNEQPSMALWVCQFFQSTAQVHARAGQYDAAAEAARQGVAFAKEQNLALQQVQLHLVLAQLALSNWQRAAVDSSLQEVAQLLEQPSLSGVDPDDYNYALLHRNFLQVMYMLRMGKVQDLLNAGGEAEAAASDANGQRSSSRPPQVVASLFGLLHELRTGARNSGTEGALQGGPRRSWLDLDCLEMLGCLLAALLLRGGSKSDLAMGYLETGSAVASTALRTIGLDDETSQADVPQQDWRVVGAYLSLQRLLDECKAQIYLSQARLQEARDVVLTSQSALERYPGLLHAHLGAVHLLTGQYCMATGACAQAAAHFQAARTAATGNSISTALAAALQAEALLALGQPNSVQLALEAMGPFYNFSNRSDVAHQLGNTERAVCRLAGAACMARQGDLSGAKEQLSKALKFAHEKLDNMQLTCSILLALVPPLLAEGDANAAYGGALEPATTLSRSSCDIFSQAEAKRQLAAVCRQRGDEASALKNLEGAGRRERALLDAVRQAAGDAGRHSYVVGWKLL